MKKKEQIEFLTNFQLHLYEIGLIGNCAWDFEKLARKYVKYIKDKKKEEKIIKNIT